MKKTVHKTRLIDGGFAEEVFSDMLDQERSKGIAIGLGDMLYQQLSRAITQPARKR
ncbi:MAG TPA: rod-binding protein [Candidatus Ozemobacteraceae bacterium]|nr:rod-binding protein [Candidatus Ozemobacteraceae bacterium]